jgi:hypothetical protein
MKNWYGVIPNEVELSKTKPYGFDRCLNCGEYGSHFIPPCFGDKGFFICSKPKKTKESDMGEEKELVNLKENGG